MKHIDARRRYFATNQLKQRIQEQGRSYRWVARQVNLSDSHFNRVLSGERWMSESNARAIAAILATDCGVLWNVAPATEMVAA